MEKVDIDTLMSYWIHFMLIFCCICILSDIISYILNFVFNAIFFAFIIGVPILFLYNNPIYLVVPAILAFCVYAHLMEESKKLEKKSH